MITVSQVLLRIPTNLKHDLTVYSKGRGQTLNGLILQILWDWIKEKDKASTTTHRRN